MSSIVLSNFATPMRSAPNDHAFLGIGLPAAAQAADCEHSWVVPAGDVFLLHELQQLAA